MPFWKELQRRHVFRVGAVYVIVAWVIAQAVTVLSEPLRLPGWFDTVVILLLAIGLPIALVLAWAFEVPPQAAGEMRIPARKPRRIKLTARQLGIFAWAPLMLLIGFIAVQGFNLKPEKQASGGPNRMYAMAYLDYVDADNSAGRHSSSEAKVIVVLPFDNLSPAAEDAHFTRGMHNELSRHLAKVNGLDVISRESAVTFLDSELSVTAIAEELQAEAVVEASINYSDDRLVLKARLIDSATGTRLWSAHYNCELQDIAAVEADIATNIAKHLQLEISPAEQAWLRKPPTKSPAAHALYIRALALFDADVADEGLEYLNRALAVDPDFAAAYARKAEYYALQIPIVGATDGDHTPPQELALSYAARALELDSESGRAWHAQALVYSAFWVWDEARRAYDRAIELDDIDWGMYANFVLHSEGAQQALAVAERNVQLNPKSAQAHYWLASVYGRLGDHQASLAACNTAIEFDPTNALMYRCAAVAHIELQNLEKAEQALRATEQLLEAADREAILPGLAIGYAQLNLADDVSRIAEDYSTQVHTSATSDAAPIWLHIAKSNEPQALASLAASIRAVKHYQPIPNTEMLMSIKDNYPNNPLLETPAFADLRADLTETLIMRAAARSDTAPHKPAYPSRN